MSGSLESRRWDDDYKNGRYEGEPPIPFVDKILDTLGEEGKRQFGLYVGCGNGRNYIPMYDRGLTNMRGIDIAGEAVSQLKEQRPEAYVWKADIHDLHQANVWDYLVSLQVFQHGNKRQAHNYFSQSRQVLKPDGLLFLRVNSVGTDVLRRHKVIGGNKDNGLTVNYKEGPKEGMNIHFFSERELGSLATRHSFDIISPPEEVAEAREEPQTGSWVQWESIWQKKQ